MLTGGTRGQHNGRFYEPTILVDHHMRPMREETFGPTLPVMTVADAEEAIALANDSAYGLNSSVWTRDRRRGEQIARRLNAGNACVNDAVLSGLALELPFGGTRDSGLGVPERRAGDGTGSIELPLVRISGDRPCADPVLRLGGGPGMTNLRFRPPAALTGHDVVLIGYRGVDGGRVLDCPEVAHALRGVEHDLLSLASRRNLARAAATAPRRLERDGVAWPATRSAK